MKTTTLGSVSGVGQSTGIQRIEGYGLFKITVTGGDVTVAFKDNNNKTLATVTATTAIPGYVALKGENGIYAEATAVAAGASAFIAYSASDESDEPKMPRGQRSIVLLGDSLTDRNKLQDATTYHWVTAKGYFTYAQQYLGFPWRVLNIASTVGDKIYQAAARIGTEVIPYKPDDCLVLIGINDAHTWTAAAEYEDAWARYRATIIHPLLDANIRPILCTLTPSNDLDAAAKQTGWFWFNEQLREYCATDSRVRLVELSTRTYSDPATGYGALSAYMDDDVHPNSAGAARIGYAISLSLSDMARPTGEFGAITGDPYNGATSTGWAFDTTAAAGTKSGTPTPTGSVVTGWTLQGACTTAAGIAIVGSVVASTDGGNDWQRVLTTATGMANQTNCSWLLNATNLTLSGSQFSVGDWVECFAEVRVTSGHTGLVALQAMVNCVSATPATFYFPRSLNSSGFVAVDDLSTVKRIGGWPVQIPPGTTALKFQMTAQFETALAAAVATIDIRNPIIRKVDVARMPGYLP